MARIMMKKAHNESISEAFEGFMLSAQSRGLTDKTLIALMQTEKGLSANILLRRFFEAFPEEAKNFYSEAMDYQEKEEKRQAEIYEKVCKCVYHMKKSELQEVLLQMLFDGPEWQYNNFVRNNGLDNDW